MLCRTFSSPKKGNSKPRKPSHSIQTSGKLLSCFPSMALRTVHISYKRNPIIYDPLGLTSFLQHGVFQVHPYSM